MILIQKNLNQYKNTAQTHFPRNRDYLLVVLSGRLERTALSFD